MKILSCRDHQEVADLLKQLNGTENVYVNWTQNDVYIEVEGEVKLSPNGDGELDLDPYTEGVEGLYYKCPKCGRYEMEHKSFSDEIYGWGEWDECTICGHTENGEGGPPAWIIEEGRPSSGPGSRAPYGMGIRDEYGGL